MCGGGGGRTNARNIVLKSVGTICEHILEHFLEQDNNDTCSTEGLLHNHNDTCQDLELTDFWSRKSKKNVYKGGSNVYSVLQNSRFSRDIKIQAITESFERLFPKLKGDEVTFIGSTFLLNGNEVPYLNHCIVKNTCNEISRMRNKHHNIVAIYNTSKQFAK